MRKKFKEIKNGSIWIKMDGITKGFVTITRKEGSTLHYKHTDDRGHIHHDPYEIPEDDFLNHFREI